MIRPVTLFSPLIGRKIVLYDTVTSTNQVMKDFAGKGEEEGLVVIAEMQTDGRGRRDRLWHSPRGKGLYVSVLLRPPLPLDQFGKISMMTALALVKTITKITRLPAAIKWPNDIFVQNKKMAGILIENSMTTTSLNSVIVGIGLNVNLLPKDMPEDLRAATTSIAIVLGRTVDKDEVLHTLLKEMNRLYYKLIRRQDAAWLIGAWQGACAHMNQEVRVSQNKYSFEGIFRGVDGSGAALLELPTSATIAIQYGDCTLRMP